MAVDGVERHMNGQTQSDESRLWHKAKQHIKRDKPGFMQRMKANATAARIVDGRCKQVV